MWYELTDLWVKSPLVERFVSQNKVADLLLVQMEIYGEKEDNSTSSCNSRFSNRDGNKEAKLTDCRFKGAIECIDTIF